MSQFENEEINLEARGDAALERLIKIAERIACALEEIAREQAGNIAQSATLKFIDLKGNTLMPATLQIGQTAQAVYTEFTGLNGTGSALPPAGPPAFSSSNTAIATVDPVSGLVTAVGPGTATITGSDSVNGLSGSDVVSDQAITAQSATVVVTAIPLGGGVPAATWIANASAPLGNTIQDGNGNTWTVTTAGTTGATLPSQFAAGASAVPLGATVSDGSVVWTETALVSAPLPAVRKR